MGGSWSVRNPEDCMYHSIELVPEKQYLIFFYLPLPLVGEVQVTYESSSM